MRTSRHSRLIRRIALSHMRSTCIDCERYYGLRPDDNSISTKQSFLAGPLHEAGWEQVSWSRQKRKSEATRPRTSVSLSCHAESATGYLIATRKKQDYAGAKRTLLDCLPSFRFETSYSSR